MKNSLLCLLCLCIAGYAQAQIPEDALRLTWLQQNGTARNQAIGGAMGSLGGDITATFVNPAGLGFYKTSEVVLSPGYNFLKNKSNFRETSTSDNKNSFNLGTSGAVFGFSNRYSRWNSGAFSIAVNRTANFNSNVFYKGVNNYSSYSEQYAEELASARVEWNDNIISNNALSIGSRMAYYTYLVDTATRNGNKLVVGAPEGIGNLNQQNLVQTTGGITEIAIGLAESTNDKFYIGGSLGLPIVNMERRISYTEKDATGNVRNGFDYSVLNETYTTKGVGLNAKFGLIFKPVHSLRIGLAIHTPTLYGLKDTYSSSMTTAVENPTARPDTFTVSSSTIVGNPIPLYNYNLVSPWKFLLSGSYVFGEVEDVTKQKGFITADVEYISYKGSNYQSADENGDNSYYDDINRTIDVLYKGAFNARVGGELKFKTLMVRGGFNYYGNPYADSELKASRINLSGGLGYRNKGFFVDLTYVYGIQKDVNFPYRLADKANTYASVKGTNGTALLTVGTKF
ncbi:MAG: aromatic hydrocarbon degradation protein [Williamsia sp.]|nr:aromatic hydrocarbon degradation protein [Williamsia sp.]